MSARQPISYEFKPFLLDAAERLLLKNGDPVAMTPKTFELLVALVENRGRLVTKERLMSLVWPNTFIEENNLAVHVSTLRKILGDGADGREYIKTLPKRGYCFVASVLEGMRSQEPAITRVRSLAVLPFKVISSEPGDDYLGLGMSDAITTRLSQVSQIIVRPTSAISRYVERDYDPIEAGRELAVEAVLSGRIARSGDRIRVTVQLVDVLENTLLWADKLDHSFTDLFTYEDFISEQIARALDLTLTGEQIDRLTKRHTLDSAAYWAYLKGRYHWNKRSPEGFGKAMEYFQYASDKDPNYSLAYSGLADCYTLLNYYGATPAAAWRAKAKEAAQRALETDETLTEAHASVALTKFWYDWDWQGAEIEFERAIQLNPAYATARQWHCWFLAAMGRHDESLREGKSALELDPLAPAINMALGKSYLFSRLFDESVRQCKRTLELDANFIPAHFFLGQAYEHQGMFREAMAEYRIAVELTRGIPLGRAILAKAEALSGRTGEAEATLHSLLELSNRDETYVPAYGIALIYLGLGDVTRTIEWLRKAFDERFIWLVYLSVDPVFDRLHGESGYNELVTRMKFPPLPGKDIHLALAENY